MKTFWFLIVLSVMVMLSGCLNTGKNNEMEPDDPPVEEQNGVQNDEQDSEQNSEVNEIDKEEDLNKPEEDKGEKDQVNQKSNDPEIVADDIVSALATGNMVALASFVHPSKDVRFSPYGYVNVDSDLVFTDLEVEMLMNDNTVYHWGSFDGSGLPIEMTFAEYYERFVYDEDYLNAVEKSVNQRLGQGNTLDNSVDVYPNGTVVEYYFPEIDPQYGGMDWRSLRLVLEKEAGQWYIVGIIHDEWTI